MDRKTTIMMSVSVLTVTWKSTAMRMRRTGGTRISGLRAVGVLREDREGTGVSGRCPGSHEGRASAAREEHAWADPGLLRDAGRTRVSRGSLEGRGDDTSEAVRKPREGGVCHREEVSSGVAGRGHEGHAGFRQGETGAHRPGNTKGKPG